MLVYSPFDQLTDDEGRDGPRNVGLLAIRAPDWRRGQRWSSKRWFTRPSTSWLMTRSEMVLEMLVYSPFDQLTADEVRDGPRNVGLLAIRPADCWRGQRWSSKRWFTRLSTSWLLTRSEMVLEMLVYLPFDQLTRLLARGLLNGRIIVYIWVIVLLPNRTPTACEYIISSRVQNITDIVSRWHGIFWPYSVRTTSSNATFLLKPPLSTPPFLRHKFAKCIRCFSFVVLRQAS